MAGPAGVGDILQETEEDRDWRDRGIGWLPQTYKGKDGFISVAYRMLASLDLQENEELSWGGDAPGYILKRWS